MLIWSQTFCAFSTVRVCLIFAYIDTERKDNYHRLIHFNVYRHENDVYISLFQNLRYQNIISFFITCNFISTNVKGIIEVKRVSGRYATRLSYRDLIIMGLKSKPSRITVNENSQAIDGSKCVWDEVNSVTIHNTNIYSQFCFLS